MAEFTQFYNFFKPSHYDVFIDINRDTKTFFGQTVIFGEAMAKEIFLHQKDLTITSVKINNLLTNYQVINNQDAVLIDLPDVGDDVITINYSGDLTDTMMGIYPSYYEIDGEKKQIIGTQFETNFARQAFPCIDEPEAKATFSLSLKFDEQPNEIVLANMPEIRVEDGIHYFDKTKRMSTYLLAFAFGELQSKHTRTKSGVNVGVYATRNHDHKTLDFALDIAKSSIEFFEDYYQTPYPLPQSNQLALPDFSAGAMENWGLVTYREAYLLIDPENTAISTQKTVATVIAHELAHQWFGDLVTMKWWDDLWLNESFANMMEYVAIDAIKPEWHIWETFQTSDVPIALKRDATFGVQPVHVDVKHPDEIDALFDPAIVYAKGARLLVMVRGLIGDNAMRLGLKNYFAKHQYANATGNDLWQALGESSNENIAEIMHAWLEKPGYPVVKAEVKEGNLVLTQSQFLIDESHKTDQQWFIPLNSNYKNVPKIMDQKTIVLGEYQSLRNQEKKAFRINIGNDSHFIVHYDTTLLQDIIQNIEKLNAIDKLQLLQDLRLLSEGHQTSYTEIIPLLSRLSSDKSAIVNNALYRIANNLKQFVEADSKEEKDLQQFFGQLSDEQFNRLGWQQKPQDTINDKLTRPYIISASLYSKNKYVINKGHELFQKYSGALNTLPADIRALVLKNEMIHFNNNQTLFNQLISEYTKTNDANYKRDIRSAISSTTDILELQQLIKLFQNNAVIKPQDLRGWFGGVLNNPKGESYAWDWVRQEWPWLEKTVGGDMEFTSYITVIASILKNEQRLLEFKTFFHTKLDQPAIKREIIMDTNEIESRVALINKYASTVNHAVCQNLKREL
ncbi:M1 family metallopeptidase [Leuconostoc palmae]|uniref:M1 family metallopeptidase n=1 Tax=Leuconostoc palmae TaxID=501487 RepID=UPI001C7D91FC|nr:M1 family metallopeptidase [Leuconostoc palmae]